MLVSQLSPESRDIDALKLYIMSLLLEVTQHYGDDFGIKFALCGLGNPKLHAPPKAMLLPQPRVSRGAGSHQRFDVRFHIPSSPLFTIRTNSVFEPPHQSTPRSVPGVSGHRFEQKSDLRGIRRARQVPGMLKTRLVKVGPLQHRRVQTSNVELVEDRRVRAGKEHPTKPWP